MKITKEKYIDCGKNKVNKYILNNSAGMSVEVLDLGCTIVSLKLPDRDGELKDVVLGYKDPMQYFSNPAFFGSVIGRISNRIAKGRFCWQGKQIELEINGGNDHLHGGTNGFWGRVWECIEDEGRLIFKINSPDKDSNYPGEIECYVSYILTEDNELIIKYKVTTPSESMANLTNHSYFNLNGDGSDSVLNHYLKINSDYFTEIAPDYIPTGKLLSVDNTPMDFRTFKTIGRDIDADYDQLLITGGYDHNYVLSEGLEIAAIVYSPESGIELEVSSDSPGMQLYTANLMGEGLIGKNGREYKQRSGFCLETQFYPDSLNHPEFPQPIVTKDAAQQFETRFKFRIRD